MINSWPILFHPYSQQSPPPTPCQIRITLKQSPDIVSILTGTYFWLCILKSVPILLVRTLIKVTLLKGFEESDQGHFAEGVQRLDHSQWSGFRAFATSCCDASGVWITQTTAQLSLSHFYFSFWPCGFWDLSSPIRDRTQALGSESTPGGPGIPQPLFSKLSIDSQIDKVGI